MLQYSGNGVAFLPNGLITTLHVTVPEGVYWKVLSLESVFTASANAGSRHPLVAFADASNTVFKRVAWHAAVVASDIHALDTEIGVAPVITILAVANQYHQVQPFTPTMLPPGYGVFYAENAAIDPVNDTATLAIQYEEYRFSSDEVPVRIVGAVQVQA